MNLRALQDTFLFFTIMLALAVLIHTKPVEAMQVERSTTGSASGAGPQLPAPERPVAAGSGPEVD